MSNLLVINTSILGEGSQSRQLVQRYVEKRGVNNFKTRDLGESPLPHLSAKEMAAWAEPENELNSLSDRLIEEVEWADEIVIGLPMYNFDIPSTFSVWIDRVARAGKTFRYTETGPVGLLKGKRVIVIATRGGKYVDTALDTQSQYIKNVFSFLGINDVEFIYSEGLAMGNEAATQAILSANSKIDELIAKTVD